MFNFSAVRPIKIVSSEVLQHLLQKNTTFAVMKHLLVVILVMLVLGTMVPGCSDAPRYDNRLTAADSLMHDYPDSALAIIEAVNRDSLTTEHDQAYRDLLLTQARYKAYIPATSDSDINRTLAYFTAHPKEREKLTRAYLYKGAILDELGFPDSAMIYYKHAEKTAAPDDHFNLGYSNMRIAQLYQRYYANDSAVVARMKIATRYFWATRDTGYLITALGTQGCYPKIVGEDTARFYLKQAISLAKQIKSSKGFQYQSKLAGSYFYYGDYIKAKELAMDIVRNGSDQCNEKQFFYYAARSYIQLNRIDSARWLMNQIPSPNTAVDSMNHYQMMADFSKATQQYDDYARYNESAKRIDTRILEQSRNSKLAETEWIWDADQHQKRLKDETDSHWIVVIAIVLLGIAVLSGIAFWFVKRLIGKYRSQLYTARRDLENMLEAIGKREHSLESEKERLKDQLDKKNIQLAEVNQKNRELEREQASHINRQVSNVIRYRHAALNELYQVVRVKSVTDDGRKQVLPLMGIVKELFETKGILHKPPQKSFWDNLRLSVDGEYQGIATFVEQNYPNLTEKEMHLFLLLCADFPNQIIKLCMNYAHDVTVSKNKKRLMKGQFGLDVKLEDFVQMYLQGELDK